MAGLGTGNLQQSAGEEDQGRVGGNSRAGSIVYSGTLRSLSCADLVGGDPSGPQADPRPSQTS